MISGLECPFVIVFVDLDRAERRIPPTKPNDVFGDNGLFVPFVYRSLDIQKELRTMSVSCARPRSYSLRFHIVCSRYSIATRPHSRLGNCRPSCPLQMLM